MADLLSQLDEIRGISKSDTSDRLEGFQAMLDQGRDVEEPVEPEVVTDPQPRTFTDPDVDFAKAIQEVSPLHAPAVPDPLDLIVPLGAGVAGFLASSAATLGQQFFRKAVEPDIRDITSLITGEDFSGKMTPEEIRAEGDRIRAGVSEAFAVQPRTEQAAKILEPIVKGFELLVLPAKKLDEFLTGIGFPNLGLSAGIVAEFGIFKGIHIGGTAAKGWVKRTNAKLRKSKSDVETENILKEASKEVEAKPELKEELKISDEQAAKNLGEFQKLQEDSLNLESSGERFQEAISRGDTEVARTIFQETQDVAGRIKAINAEQKSAVQKQRDIQRELDRLSPEPEVGKTPLIRETRMEELAKTTEDAAIKLEAEGNVAEATKIRLEADVEIMKDLGIQAAVENVKAREVKKVDVVEEVREKAAPEEVVKPPTIKKLEEVSFESPNAARDAGFDLNKRGFNSQGSAEKFLATREDFNQVIKAGEKWRVAKKVEAEVEAPRKVTKPLTEDEIKDRMGKFGTIEDFNKMSPEELLVVKNEIRNVSKDLTANNPSDFDMLNPLGAIEEIVNTKLGLKERPEFVERIKPKSLPATPLPQRKVSESRRLLEEAIEEVETGEVAAERFIAKTERGGEQRVFEELKPEDSTLKDLESQADAILKSAGDTILNEKGSVDLSIIRDAIEAAKRKKVPFDEFLKGTGMNEKQVKQVLKQANRIDRLNELETQAAMPETYETGPIINQKDRFSIHKDRHGVETALSKLPVYQRQLEVFTSNKDLGREQVVGGFEGSIKDLPSQFRTPIRVMERFSPELVDMIALPYEGRFKASNIRMDAETSRIRVAKKGMSLKEKDQLGVHMIGRDPKGVDINKANNATPVKLEELSPRQLEGMKWLNEEYLKLHGELNEARAGIGMEPVPFLENYAAFIQTQNIAGFRDTGYNLVMANGNSITNTYKGFNATPFHHVKPRSKTGQGKIINDPFNAYERYMRQSIEHIYISPILALVDQMRFSMILPETGKLWTLESHRPKLDKYLGDWSMRVAKIDTHPMGPGISKAASILSRNLTYATLSNFRSGIIQPTALINVYADVGLTNTLSGITSLVKPGTHARVFEKSRHIQKDIYDANVSAMWEGVRSGKLGGLQRTVGKGSLAFLRYADYETRIATFSAAYRYAKKSRSPRLTEQQAINYADIEVIKTQASASPGMISPIQGTALGKAGTLWQTFVINNIGFLMSDVAGFKNPRVGNKRALVKGTRFLIAATMIGTLFEDVIGIQSPILNPIGAGVRSVLGGDTTGETAIKILKEFIEPFPVVGTVKWGGTMLGAVAEFIGDISKIISPGIGDPKVLSPKHLIQTGEMVAKGFGVPFTGQISGSRKAAERGENLFGILLRSYDEGKKSSKLKGLSGLGGLKGL